MNRKYLFLIPLSLFVVDWYLVSTGLIQGMDECVYAFVRTWRCDTLTVFFKVCSELGSAKFYIVAVFALMIFKGQDNIIFGLHLGIVQIINRVIKVIVARQRPEEALRLVVEHSYSFPSGHSMSAMAGYGLMIIHLYQSQYKYKKLFIALLALMILLIGLSRIYLGVHYMSDVAGGFLLSLSYLLFVYENSDFYI